MKRYILIEEGGKGRMILGYILSETQEPYDVKALIEKYKCVIHNMFNLLSSVLQSLQYLCPLTEHQVLLLSIATATAVSRCPPEGVLWS